MMFVLVIFILYTRQNIAVNAKQPQHYDLLKDGICIIKNTLTPNEISELIKKCNQNNYKSVKEEIQQNPTIYNAILNKTGKGYEFHDYIFILKESAIHTCHRDANGSMFNNLSSPSYTMILYLDSMDKCLGIIPQSHKDPQSYAINIKNPVKDVLCNKGDILLFDANIIHTGIITESPHNLRIQMKISHKSDISTLSYYTNYNKILNEKNEMPIELQKIQQNASCMFPIISNYTQSDVKNTTQLQKDSYIPLYQQIFSYLFYGDRNYYNLKNAF